MAHDYLTEKDHNNLDRFLRKILDGYKNGEMTRSAAIGSLTHVITAIDKENLPEARRWIEEGSTFLDGAS